MRKEIKDGIGVEKIRAARNYRAVMNGNYWPSDAGRLDDIGEEFKVLSETERALENAPEEGLVEVADRFLRRKATIGELRAAVKAAKSPIQNYWMEEGPCGPVTVVRKNGVVEICNPEDLEGEI